MNVDKGASVREGRAGRHKSGVEHSRTACLRTRKSAPLHLLPYHPSPTPPTSCPPRSALWLKCNVDRALDVVRTAAAPQSVMAMKGRD
ncbi:hypothetical protein E2C01_038875 [Portunus trituberculatus]|uniref:Uncharacterized protein n=1 Tax=Portunus trituberculatus TaxID=210409 RepID=A0A5B7FIB6_PORTR|nr:hypothetical protein [Portunus trituberculatus]